MAQAGSASGLWRLQDGFFHLHPKTGLPEEYLSFLTKKPRRDGGQSAWKRAECGEGGKKNQFEPSPEASSLQNLPPLESPGVKATSQAQPSWPSRPLIQMKSRCDLYLSVTQLRQHMNSVS